MQSVLNSCRTPADRKGCSANQNDCEHLLRRSRFAHTTQPAAQRRLNDVRMIPQHHLQSCKALIRANSKGLFSFLPKHSHCAAFLCESLLSQYRTAPRIRHDWRRVDSSEQRGSCLEEHSRGTARKSYSSGLTVLAAATALATPFKTDRFCCPVPTFCCSSLEAEITCSCLTTAGNDMATTVRNLTPLANDLKLLFSL